MRTSVRTVTAISAVALFWAGLAYDLSRPADYRAYHRTVLQVAAAAYDAAQTGRLIGEQVLADKATKPYATTTFDDAIKALAGAQKQFASQPPPDERSRRLRDEIGPLLAREVAALGDTAEATDEAALRAGVRTLGDVARHLDTFIEAHQ
jgi:hypothetical protein